MKYLLPALIISLCLAGFGCLEGALEYPKEFKTDEMLTEMQTVNLIGVVQSINNETNQIQIVSAGGFIEEIKIIPETTISFNNETRKNLLDIASGSLVEVAGTRDQSTLIVTAKTIQTEDLTRIKLTSPDSGATVTSPLIVEGFAKTTNQKIYWRIKDQNNAVQRSGENYIGGEEKTYITFRLEIYLPALEAKNFTLEVFTKQPTEVGLVSLPLNLLSINKSELQVFFSNDKLNTSRACDVVFPVTRTVAETSATGRASLLELLNGSTDSERIESYRSSLPANTTINSFVISGGVATVTVSKDFEKNSACEKQRATEQIKQTLLQIDSIHDVVIQTEE